MTVRDASTAPPAALTEVDADRALHARLSVSWDRPPGVYGWLTSVDHKEIGLRFVCTAFIFFCMAGVLALLMRVQLSLPKNTFLGPDAYNQIFTTHGTAMLFLFAVPVMEGMGLYLVPLMVGARNVAFPRLINFGYYVYLLAGIALFTGLFLNMGPDTGWFSYPPLAGPQYSPGHRVDLWSQMVTLVEVSAISSAIAIITTILKQRAVGMSLNRMPLFVWSQLVTAFMVLFAMPAIMLCSTMLSMDRLTNIATHFYNPAEGGDALLWQHLFWFFDGGPLSPRRIRFGGDTAVVYWSPEPKTEVQDVLNGMPILLDPPDDVADVGALLSAARTGVMKKLETPAAFYAMTLTSVTGRIVVRDWFASSVADLQRNLLKHFEDVDCVRNTPDTKGVAPRGVLRLEELMNSLAAPGREVNIPTTLATDFIHAAMRGTPYPFALLQRCLLRARAEAGSGEWNDFIRRDARASLLKAVLNRSRLADPGAAARYPEVTRDMDPNNSSIGYNLGALLAVLERLQAAALDSVNASLVDAAAAVFAGGTRRQRVGVTLRVAVVVARAGGGAERVGTAPRGGQTLRQHLNTLFVTLDDAYLAKSGEAVLVRHEKTTKLRLPIHTLGGIVCFGRVGVSPSLMHLCGERGVAISLLTGTGRFLAKIDGFASGNVVLRREQYRRADDLSAACAIARNSIAAKIANARSVLMRAVRDYPDAAGRATLDRAVFQLAESARLALLATDLDGLRGLEGDASRVYFDAFDHAITQQKEAFAFRTRSRRPPLDPVNALLSFLYAMLAHDCRAACETVGLDPAVGFLHRDRPGRPGLALDLMEEFRPVLADRLALSLINRRQVDATGFETTASGAVRMSDASRKAVLVAYQKRKQEEILHPFLGEPTSLGLLPHLQARLLARHLRGDLDAYPAFIWK